MEKNDLKKYILNTPHNTNSNVVLSMAEEVFSSKSVTVEPLTVTENGVYPPESGKAFGTVTVNVPDSGDAMTDVSEVGM